MGFRLGSNSLDDGGKDVDRIEAACGEDSLIALTRFRDCRAW